MGSSTVALLSLLYLAGQQHGAHSGLLNAGFYDLKLLRVENCEDVGTGEFNMDVRLSKKSTHKTFLRGIVVNPYDCDDNVHGEMNFSRFGSRGWGMNAYHTTSNNYCKTFQKNVPHIFQMVYSAYGIENPTCPIKAGNYTLDMDTDLPRLRNFPMLPYGTYRISHALSYGDPPVRIGCTSWYISCTERPRT